MATVRFRIVVLVAMALMLAACSAAQTVPPTTEIYGIPIPTIRVPHLVPIPPTTQPTPGVDLSATPAGWVPVEYGDAQASVPSTFYVFYGAPDLYSCLALDSPGDLLVIPRKFKPIITTLDCPGLAHFNFPATVVSFVLTHRPVYVAKKLTTLNGLPVYLGRSRTTFHCYAPSLGVEITTAGLLARRIPGHVHSFTPRSCAYSRGSTSGTVVVAVGNVRRVGFLGPGVLAHGANSGDAWPWKHL